MKLQIKPASIFLLLVEAAVHGAHLEDATTSTVIATDNNDPTVADYTFEQYVQKFGKSYHSKEEYIRRHAIFETNQRKILKHNNYQTQQQQQLSSSSYIMGINQFTDQLDNELPLGYNKASHAAWKAKNPNHHHDFKLYFLTFRTEDLPTMVDWRLREVTTPVKNQGLCLSSWAFAATAALESHIALQTGKLFTLSVQEFVSCAPNNKFCGGVGGCDGSMAEMAFDFAVKHGVVDEWSFGYQSYNHNHVDCTLLDDNDDESTEKAAMTRLLRGTKNDHGSSDSLINGAVATIVGFSNLPTNSYNALMKAVATVGPVAVNVATSGWALYSHGIFDDDEATSRDINHVVVVEGYGTDQETGQDYWLVRNSWGPKWGENGYIRLKRVDPSTLDVSDCKFDNTPYDGIACHKDDNGNHLPRPQPKLVCGTSGILYDGVIPIGGHLIEDDAAFRNNVH